MANEDFENYAKWALDRGNISQYTNRFQNENRPEACICYVIPREKNSLLLILKIQNKALNAASGRS